MKITIRPLGRQTQSACTVTCFGADERAVFDACKTYGLPVRVWGAGLLVSARPTIIKDALTRAGLDACIADGLTISRSVAA